MPDFPIKLSEEETTAMRDLAYRESAARDALESAVSAVTAELAEVRKKRREWWKNAARNYELDMEQFVYLVDSGPDAGQITLKGERDDD